MTPLAASHNLSTSHSLATRYGGGGADIGLRFAYKLSTKTRGQQARTRTDEGRGGVRRVIEILKPCGERVPSASDRERLVKSLHVATNKRRLSCSALAMPPPTPLPSSPKRVLVITNSGVTRLEPEMPQKKAGFAGGPFPAIVLLRNSEQARYVQNCLNGWLPGAVRSSPTPQQLRDKLQEWEMLEQISNLVQQMGEGYTGFYLDVRTGRRPGVYCSSREAFLMMSDVPLKDRRALVYDSFRDAFLSAFLRPGEKPHVPIYDFHSRLGSVKQLELAQVIISGIRPGGSPPILSPHPLPASQHPSQDAENLALLQALEATFGWAHYYLHAHGFGDETHWIQDRYDLCSGEEEFVNLMMARFGEARFAEYSFIYTLFKDL
ncbi:hypothetical protein V5O48_015884 [Marasmius crinis-equi]|uniref:Uncharacterized protein n=1 Tax=Marasmius crinis-equi TaxID=585013 RepID=A0ABR3ETB8_9AGAR